jgi:hypothetical protein
MMKAFALTALSKLVIASPEVMKDEQGRRMQQMQVQAPVLSEEDQWGQVMPDMYRCDACKAVVYHLNQGFEKRQIKSRRMHEWEYNEVFEETCGQGHGDSAFQGYGIKLIDGKNALTGPGLKQPDNSIPPGGAFIQMSSKGWDNRLSDMCRSIVYDKVGEDELYEKFHSNKRIPDSMCYEEVAHCGSKSKKSKAGSKKAKAKMTPAAAPAKLKESPQATPTKPKDLPQVEVKYDGSASNINKTEPHGAIDADSFLQSLALEDGLDFNSYTGKRSRDEWEKLIVAMAGKIYSRQV